MKKNLYYRHILGRKNLLKNLIYGFFFAISSYPKLVLEVFIRKNFGERYFSFASVLTVAFLMFVLPAGVFAVTNYLPHYGSTPDFRFTRFITWYLFIPLFLFFAIQRRKEVKRLPSVFDFSRFSLSAGQLQPWFYKFIAERHSGNERLIECVYEPLPFFILGIPLAIMGQYLGWLLMVSSLIYGISYAAGYHRSDNWIMDKIDEMIANEEMEKSFIEDEDPSQTRGFKFLPRKPRSEEMRRQLMDEFFEEDYDDSADDVR